MPLYTAKCSKCGGIEDYARPVSKRMFTPLCPMGCGSMDKILTPTSVSVFPDYITVAFDKEQGKRIRISSKGEHEAFLRRNDYNEVGTDRSSKPLHPEAVKEDHARQRAEAIEDAKNTVYDWQD